jgi:RING finger protein 121
MLSACRALSVPSPRQVYAWFMVVFRVSVGVGFVGYIMLILEFTGLGLLFRGVLGPGAALTGGWRRPASSGRAAL